MSHLLWSLPQCEDNIWAKFEILLMYLEDIEAECSSTDRSLQRAIDSVESATGLPLHGAVDACRNPMDLGLDRGVTIWSWARSCQVWPHNFRTTTALRAVLSPHQWLLSKVLIHHKSHKAPFFNMNEYIFRNWWPSFHWLKQSFPQNEITAPRSWKVRRDSTSLL